MPRLSRPGHAAIRAVRRGLRRIVHIAWRVLRVVVLAGAAAGPRPPPPPPPPPAPIEAHAEERAR